MSRIKIIRPSADEMKMLVKRYIMPATGAYYKVKSAPPIINYPSTQVVEYR